MSLERGGRVQFESSALPALLALLGLLGTMSGCAVGPNFTRPKAPLPGSWSAKDDPRVGTQTAVDKEWWRSFGDPALDQLVELAYRQNLPLQIAGLRIVEARAQLGITTGKLYPQLQVATGSANAVGLSQNVANAAGLTTQFVDYQVGFDAAWELDFWGKYRRGIESDQAALLSSVADYDSALVSLSAEVARTYVVIRTYEVLIRQAEENAKLQEEGLKIAQSRFSNGATSELDVAQANTLLQSTRATVPQLQVGRQQAENALSTLVGQPPGTVRALLAGPQEIPSVPPKVSVSVPAEMLRRRPDIRSAELSAAAQCARIGVAKADLYPSFSILGSVGLQASAPGGASANLFSGHSLYYSVGPRIVWPFFNYGRLTNAVRVEDARFQQLLVGYRNVVLSAAQEVEDALVGFLKNQEAATFVHEAVESGRRSAQLAMVEYQEGATDYQRVLDAQRSLLVQENTLAQTHSAVTTSLISLYKALGGGWESREGQPIVPQQTQSEMKTRTNWGGLLNEPRAPEATSNPADGSH
jgi:NodT family efflux transporter outer membrane factor (OMF) lipoprotein